MNILNHYKETANYIASRILEVKANDEEMLSDYCFGLHHLIKLLEEALTPEREESKNEDI